VKGGFVLKEPCILFGRFEREFDTPQFFSIREEALAAMKAAIIDAMDGLDESVFDDYTIDEDYFWQPDSNSAWFNYRHGNSGWEIYNLDEFLNPSAKAENSDEPKAHTLIVALTVNVTEEDVDDIMCAALEGGINYWCSEAEVVGEYLGKYAHEQISKGGKLVLHDSEGDEKHELTREKFLKGLRLFLVSRPNFVDTETNCIDASEFDAEYADEVIQLAVFGEVKYS
jgi:hypothetical protein